MKQKLDNYFKISERGSSISTEMIGGATTFATMAYILFITTGAMSVTDANLSGVLLCTCLTTALAIFANGLVSNTPICLAPVLVIPNLVAQMIKDGTATYEVAFGIVLWSGIIFFIVSLGKLREVFAKSLPKNMKVGLAAAVGLLIARIGLGTSGLINENLIGMPDFSNPSVQLGVIGLVIAFLLTYTKFKINGREYRVKGALLISIVLTTVIGIFMGVVQLPASIFTSAPFSAIGDTAFRFDLFGALRVEYIPFFLMLLLNDFFGTLGSSLALAGKANLLDKEGNFPAVGRVFLVDASATMLGALFGITTISTFAESAAGIESGSRTGLSNMVTGLLFVLCMFFAPIFLVIPSAATGSAMIIIGISMLETLGAVDFKPLDIAPVAVMMFMTVFMFDYVGGIALGMITYVIIQFLRFIFGGEKKVIPSVPALVLAALMVLYFVF